MPFMLVEIQEPVVLAQPIVIVSSMHGCTAIEPLETWTISIISHPGEAAIVKRLFDSEEWLLRSCLLYQPSNHHKIRWEPLIPCFQNLSYRLQKIISWSIIGTKRESITHDTRASLRVVRIWPVEGRKMPKIYTLPQWSHSDRWVLEIQTWNGRSMPHPEDYRLLSCRFFWTRGRQQWGSANDHDSLISMTQSIHTTTGLASASEYLSNIVAEIGSV